jgi:hypothetical protein
LRRSEKEFDILPTEKPCCEIDLTTRLLRLLSKGIIHQGQANMKPIARSAAKKIAIIIGRFLREVVA